MVCSPLLSCLVTCFSSSPHRQRIPHTSEKKRNADLCNRKDEEEKASNHSKELQSSQQAKCSHGGHSKTIEEFKWGKL